MSEQTVAMLKSAIADVLKSPPTKSDGAFVAALLAAIEARGWRVVRDFNV